MTLGLTFRCYEASEIPTSNKIFYFFPELYAIIRAMLIIPMELTVPGVIFFWLGLTSSETATSGTVRVAPRVGPTKLQPSEG